MIFHYLDAFAPDQEQVHAFKTHYEKGGLGDVVLKKYLFSVLDDLLAPIVEKRHTVRDQDAMEILMEGSKQARQRVQEKMKHVRAAMQLDYSKPMATDPGLHPQVSL